LQGSLESVAQAICDANGYDLVGRVGAGAFKETFHVRMSDGTSQALKIFQQVNSTERTQRELDAMIKCDHPNIGTFSSVDTFSLGDEEHLYTLEEYLPGGTLNLRVTGTTLSPEETQTLGEILISAVSHIAELDLVHRDLKPDNIMFRDSSYRTMARTAFS
jgi:serine/threonine protein kinase